MMKFLPIAKKNASADISRLNHNEVPEVPAFAFFFAFCFGRKQEAKEGQHCKNSEKAPLPPCLFCFPYSFYSSSKYVSSLFSEFYFKKRPQHEESKTLLAERRSIDEAIVLCPSDWCIWGPSLLEDSIISKQALNDTRLPSKHDRAALLQLSFFDK